MCGLLFKIHDCQKSVFLEFIAGGADETVHRPAQPPTFAHLFQL